MRLLPSFLSLLVLAAALNGSVYARDSSQRINVVTSVAPITNIAQNVGGQFAGVTGIIANGTDSHTFEPAPADARTLASADLIIINGLGLEIPTIKLAEKVKKPATPIVQLGNRTLQKEQWQYDFSFPRDRGLPNPHLWPDIALAIRYAEIVRDSLIAADPANKERYQANAAIYLTKLKKLDNAIFECVKSIPEKNRKLVTYHDSFAYFAPRYGMKVIAAVQPSDFSEPGPREVIRIIKQIRKEQVPAIFGSEVFPSKVMERIARETGARFVDELSDDELPPPPNDSFIGMMVKNMAIMTAALGGEPACVAEVDVSNITH